jgi:MFS family permease
METPVTRRWPVALRSLRHREFRILWISLIISAVGTWMQIVAQSLLVLYLTHGSALALGVVALAQALAFFVFALAGGGFADRLDRRRLLLATQTLLMCLALLIGLLTVTGKIQVWMIVVIAFLSGAILSFDQPARAALISSVVPKEDLLNAVGLQSAVFNAASTVGPALAGITVDRVGLPANFFLNAISFLAVLVALFSLRSTKSSSGLKRPKLIYQIAEALVTVKRDSVLPWLLLSYGVLLFSGPSLPLLLPVLAVRNLHISASDLGFLFSAAGLGAVLGALAMASISDKVQKSPIVFGAFAFWTSSLIFVAFSKAVVPAFVALIVLGISQNVIGTVTSTLLQLRVPHDQRGRVMSLNTLLIMGVRPLGDFPAGLFISIWGAPFTAAAGAMIVGLTALLLFARSPSMRSI